MREQGKDQELRELFHDLRKQDQERVPDFAAMMSRARGEASGSTLNLHPRSTVSSRFPRKLAWGGSLMAAAAAAVLLLFQIPGTSDSEFERVVNAFSVNPASGAWKSPTDALLDVPGGEILSTVPSIGASRLLSDRRPNTRRDEL